MRYVYAHWCDLSKSALLDMMPSLKTELLAEEKIDQAETHDVTPTPENEESIGFKSCSFSWDKGTKGKKKTDNTRDRFELRFDDEITFKRGAINIIIGPTASGKVSRTFFSLFHFSWQTQTG